MTEETLHRHLYALEVLRIASAVIVLLSYLSKEANICESNYKTGIGSSKGAKVLATKPSKYWDTSIAKKIPCLMRSTLKMNRSKNAKLSSTFLRFPNVFRKKIEMNAALRMVRTSPNTPIDLGSAKTGKKILGDRRRLQGLATKRCHLYKDPPEIASRISHNKKIRSRMVRQEGTVQTLL